MGRANMPVASVSLAMGLLLFSAPSLWAISYYVSNHGDDDALGTSDQEAWQTLARVNEAAFLPGDEILLKRGDEWYEALTLSSSGTSENPIVLSHYGTGPRPRILGSKELTQWSLVAGSVWVSVEETTDPSRGAPHDGSQSGSGGYPGGAFFVELDGSVTWGNEERYVDFAGDFSELKRAYDWGWYDNHIYIYSNGDPSQAYLALQVTQRQFAIGMENNDPAEHIVIDGLELLYTQSKGFYAGYPAREAHDLTIKNCRVAYVGIRGAASAYGLAVWHSDLEILDNEIHDCGRRGLSYNVYATRNVTFENVLIEGNHFHHGYHTTGVDIYSAGSDQMKRIVIRNNYFAGDPSVDLSAEGFFNSNHIWTQANQEGRLRDFFFINNIFTYCHGKGLTVNNITNAHVYFNTFYGVNPTLANYQAQLYFSNSVTNAVVRNNIFYNDVDPAFNGTFFSVKADSHHLPQVDMDYNLFFASRPDASIVDIVGITGSYTMDEWPIYQAETGWDGSSPLPEDPAFVDGPGLNLHLDSGSPAIGAGETVAGVTQDYTGAPRNHPPSLGAYAYPQWEDVFSDGFEAGGLLAWTTLAK